MSLKLLERQENFQEQRLILNEVTWQQYENLVSMFTENVIAYLDALSQS